MSERGSVAIRFWTGAIVWGVVVVVLSVVPLIWRGLVRAHGDWVFVSPALAYGGSILYAVRVGLGYAHLQEGAMQGAGKRTLTLRAQRATLIFFMVAWVAAPSTSSIFLWQEIHRPSDVGVTVTNPYSNGSISFTGRDWTKEFSPDYLDSSHEDAFRASGGCDVLLVTASYVERRQVERKLAPLPDEDLPRRVFEGGETYYVGLFGDATAVLVQCEQGSVGPRSSEIVTARGIAVWKPQAVICLGAAFAVNAAQCSPGDVLVSSWLFPYEHQKVSPNAAVPRAVPLIAGFRLWRAFHEVPNWTFPEPELSSSVEAHYGPMFTGEKLVNSLSLRNQLLGFIPLAIGGEMEGAGVAAAADQAKVEWIVVKGVMDWADGKKNDSYQVLAAAAATDLAYEVLSNDSAVALIRSGP